jgi:hypothetical protein
MKIGCSDLILFTTRSNAAAGSEDKQDWEPVSKRSIRSLRLSRPISALVENFNPRNTPSIPAVEIFDPP